MSDHSSARTWVISRARAETISGKRSVMPPGWMPVPWSVTPPLRQAASTSATWGVLKGKNQPSGVTTFFPDSRIRITSAVLGMMGA